MQRTTNDQPTRRRSAATAMAIGVVLLGVAVAPGVASAHHPILSGTTSCRTDAWTVRWTATADADRNLTWSITSPGGYSPSGFQDDQAAFTRTDTYPGTQASAVETVTAEWSNRSTASATATVDRPPLCEVATTPTTTTTTSPETTTTTNAPETTVSQAGPTSTVGQSEGESTNVGGGGQLPATGGGSLNLTIIALTLIGIGAVMLRLTSKPAR
jgi:hypothetical protein